MSIRLYVGNLPKSDVEREELETVFADAGELVSVKVIKDRKTGKCRGFGFVTVETDEQADQIIEKYNGAKFQDIEIKIEKALPKAKGEDEDGEGAAPAEPREPSNVPKPTLNKKVAGETSTPRRSTGGGGSKKGGRKEGNKTQSGGNTYTTTATTDSFQPDPRWAGTLADIKNKLAESGNL
jgi:RNA recognition motif-containing protein